jgi:hypothetical protein
MNQHEIINRFTGTSTRYDGLGKPWMLKDGRIVATDGKAMIVLDAEHQMTIDQNLGKVPDPEDILKKSPPANAFYKHLKEFPDPSPFMTKEECPDCHGTGHFGPCVGPDRRDCQECDGKGSWEYEDTEDKSKYFWLTDGAEQEPIQRTILGRFKGLTNLRYAIHNELVWLWFDGGIGVIKPLSK